MDALAPSDWRPVALHQLVRSTTLLGLPLAVFTIVFPWTQGAARLTSPSHAIMLGCFFAAAFVEAPGWSFRRTAWAWVLCMAGTTMAATLTFGLPPAVVLAGVLVATSAGALLGPSALLATLGGMSVAFLAAGATLQLGWVEPILPTFATRTMLDWGRASFEFALVGGSAAVLLRLVVAQNERQEALLAERVRLEALGRFAGGIAHDFNNALQIVVMWSELLGDHDDPQVVEAAEEMRAAAARGHALTRRLMATDPSREGTSRTFDLAATVEHWHRSMGRLVPSDIAFTARCEGPAWVEGDELAVEQVLLNLVVNARDALGGKGHLNLHVEVLSEHVRLRVSDDGPGIDTSVKTTLFEPFVSGQEGPGRGLGLSIVRSAVRRLNGTIDVRSEPGQTVFEVRLPRVAAPLAAEAAPTARAVGQSPQQGTVLVADDDPAILRGIASGLRAVGWDVIEAADGDEALDALKATAPDVLCTDGIMPGTPVREVIAQYQALRPDGRVVVCSGHLPEELAIRSLGQLECVDKPFTLEQLIAVLSKGSP